MQQPLSATQLLAGVRVVEISSFVAVPLAGMTLAQMGCEVIRVDPVGGAADYHRWPLAPGGVSIYWTGLNKGKRSIAVDMKRPEGQALVRRLIVEGGPSGGILITNVVDREWHSYDSLKAARPDLIHLEVSGRSDGRTGVDYTVNAGTGFPRVTGQAGGTEPVNHVLPAWDVSCGIYAALGIAAAIRHRESTGRGSRIRLPLEDVALATAGNLSFLTEPMVNHTQRQRLGNSIYGQYGQNFKSADGVDFMIVALTGRHLRDLVEVTDTSSAVLALAEALGADFTDEGDRFRHREALTSVFTPWFGEHSADEVAKALGETSVLWDRYNTFAETAVDPRVTANPLFTDLKQPGVGRYLAPGLPLSIDGGHTPAVAAPALGDDTAEVLIHRLGMSRQDIDQLRAAGFVSATCVADGDQ